jgi:hypothetical protein
LDKLKELGLIEWHVGKARLTEKGLKVLAILNGDRALIDEKAEETTNRKPASGPEDMTQLKDELKFRIFDCEELKKLKKHVDDGFVFVEYPKASYIFESFVNRRWNRRKRA